MVPEPNELLRLVAPTTLGRRIHAARTAAGLTDADLGLAPVELADLEHGVRRPGLATLAAIAERTGASLAVLLTGLTDDELLDIEGRLDRAELRVPAVDPAHAIATADRLLARLAKAGATAPHLERAARRLRAAALEAAGELSDAIVELLLVTAEPLREVRWLEDLISLSRCYRETGDHERAIQVGTERQDVVRELGLDGTTEAIQLLVTVAAAYIFKGDYRHALRLCLCAAEEADRFGLPVGRASALWNASLVKLDQLDPAAALDLALEALRIYEENGDLRRTGALRAQIACIELEFEPPNAASALQHLALAEPELEWGGAGVIAKARHRLARARAHRELGDPDAAQRALDESALLLPPDAPGLRAWHSVVLAQLAADRRDFDAAHARLQDAAQRLTALGADSDAGRAWTRLGDTLVQVGEHARAADAYRRAGVSLGLRPSR
ncbi:hypothetical protein GCM10022237_51230 [Nocardioides ginsengisoli]|uniref:Helix-turn-helix domain-containing protein n=1 Tax=Nocardioides ginsengisoli TaxID=363868 RepID=A0ABW3VWZ1_9ACTN